MKKPDPKIIIVGRLGSPYGVKGWQRLQSFTDPAENILNYEKHLLWQIDEQWQPLKLEAIQTAVKGFLIKLPQIHSPEEAKKYSNTQLAIAKEYLPKTTENEFYHSDLIGLKVINQKKQHLGEIAEVLATGSNDVLVVINNNKRILIPYLNSVIQLVDIKNQTVTVNWEEI